MKSAWEKVACFAGGVLFGTAGLKILGSKDAKKAYTHTTAAILRAEDTVMTTVSKIKENAGDVLADAKDINEQRAAKEDEIVEDTAAAPEEDTADADAQEE